MSLLDERWDDLVRRQLLPNPTLSTPWLRHLLETEPGEPVVIVAERDGALLAAGAFGLYRPAGRAGPLFARWLGDPRLWFSPELPVAPDAATAGEVALDALLGVADIVHLQAPRGGAATAALRARVPWLSALGSSDGWITPMPPARQEAALKRHRKDLARAARFGSEVGMRRASDPDRVAAALERLFALHAERWRSRSGDVPRFSATEAQRDWFRRVTAAMAERGEARIAEVVENGQLVSSELAFIAGTGGVLHTTATRPGGELKEPGRAVQLEILFELEAAGVRAVDLGLGAGQPGGPKASIGPTRVEVERLLAADSRRAQQLAVAALGLGERLRAGRRRRRS